MRNLAAELATVAGGDGHVDDGGGGGERQARQDMRELSVSVGGGAGNRRSQRAGAGARAPGRGALRGRRPLVRARVNGGCGG